MSRASNLDRMIADIRHVAQSLGLKPGAALTHVVYQRWGGRYGPGPIGAAGGWVKLSAAAGYPSRNGFFGTPRHPWKKTKPAMTGPELDAALDDALGREPVPRGILCMMGRKRRKGPRGPRPTVHRELVPLDRGEIIADIRQVALSLGLLSPRLLTFDTYRNHGGRYSYDQTAPLGGFDAIRCAA